MQNSKIILKTQNMLKKSKIFENVQNFEIIDIEIAKLKKC